MDALGRAERETAKSSVDRRLRFAPWISVRYVSALRGQGVKALLANVDAIRRASAFDAARRV